MVFGIILLVGGLCGYFYAAQQIAEMTSLSGSIVGVFGALTGKYNYEAALEQMKTLRSFSIIAIVLGIIIFIAAIARRSKGQQQ